MKFKYAYVDNGVFKKLQIFDYQLKLEDIRRDRNGYVLRPVIVDQPSYDANTHYLTGPIYQVQPTQVNEIYTAVAKTDKQLDAEKTNRVHDIDVVLIKILFNVENRIRALENKPQITFDQFKQFIKNNLI